MPTFFSKDMYEMFLLPALPFKTIYWVVPLPSTFGKCRFIEILIEHGINRVVNITSKGDKPKHHILYQPRLYRHCINVRFPSKDSGHFKQPGHRNTISIPGLKASCTFKTIIERTHSTKKANLTKLLGVY